MGGQKPSKRRTRKPEREPYSKVLIVCEGTKTEPNYFKGLKDRLRLNSANLEIVGRGASPEKIVGKAKELYKKEKARGDPFDKVFCVFDKDNHDDYKKALDMLSRHRPYEAINSVPAFEYWILLHYVSSTRPYTSVKELISDLEKHHGVYKKGEKDIFNRLEDKLDCAKENAGISLQAAEKAKTDNPSTRVHILVDFLQNIKKPL